MVNQNNQQPSTSVNVCQKIFFLGLCLDCFLADQISLPDINISDFRLTAENLARYLSGKERTKEIACAFLKKIQNEETVFWFLYEIHFLQNPDFEGMPEIIKQSLDSFILRLYESIGKVANGSIIHFYGSILAQNCGR